MPVINRGGRAVFVMSVWTLFPRPFRTARHIAGFLPGIFRFIFCKSLRLEYGQREGSNDYT